MVNGALQQRRREMTALQLSFRSEERRESDVWRQESCACPAYDDEGQSIAHRFHDPKKSM